MKKNYAKKFIAAFAIVAITILSVTVGPANIAKAESGYTDQIILENLELVEYITSKLYNFETEIYLTGFEEPTHSIGFLFKVIKDSNPKLFYVSYYCTYTEETKCLHVSYLYSEEETYEMLEDLENEMIKYLELADDSYTSVQKALVIHDLMIQRVTYNPEGWDNNLIYPELTALVFTEGLGVCGTISEAYRILMMRLGIPCRTPASHTMTHGWDAIQLEDGNWYHSDVTWDNFDTRLSNVGHNQFMLIDDLIAENHCDWQSSFNIEADSTAYDNFFWRNVNSPIIEKDGLWYFIGDNSYSPQGSGLYTYNFTTGEVNKVHSINTTWVRAGIYSGLSIYNGHLYINTSDAIYVLDDNFNRTEVARASGNNQIWGFEINYEGNLVYQTSPDICSEEFEFHEIQLFTPLKAPEWKSLIVDNGTAYLRWTPVNGAVAYEVYRSTSKVGEYESIGVVTGCSFIDYQEGDETYYYRLRALGSDVKANSPFGTRGSCSEMFTPINSGDVDGNGIVNVSDATLAMRHTLGLIALTEEEATRGDVNGDGKLDIADATLILQIAMGA